MPEGSAGCPWCGGEKSIKMPCCGHLCMSCGKNYDEEDIKNNSIKKEDKDDNSGRKI
jgi:hypothetical protein